MNWYKFSQSESFQDWFLKDIEKAKMRKVIKIDPPSVKNITLTLYRGFDADINKLEKINGNYVLSPNKSEQGVIWFSQKLDVAKGRGKYILIYPLNCKKHFQVVHYSDGSNYTQIPKEILDKTNPLENCKYHMGIELPEGWLFSYKTEKHIICEIPIMVKPEMIKKDDY